MLTEDEKWNAVVQCDSTYDRVFWYGVKTTGIFCRPSCKSKVPLRHNVAFFNDLQQAYDSGLRPCKRCRPDLVEFNPALDVTEKVKFILDTCYDDRLQLADRMKELRISRNHLISLFRKQYHATPVEYCNRLRIAKAAQLIKESDETILSIALLCGFGSLSTFYQFFKKHIGLTPQEYRKINKKCEESNDYKCQQKD